MADGFGGSTPKEDRKLDLTEPQLKELLRQAFLAGVAANQGTKLYDNDRFMLQWADSYAASVLAINEGLAKGNP